MSEELEAKPTSKLIVLFYIIVAAVLLTIFLEATGLADVAGKQETEQIIDRPHD
ncbi:MAG: hypothetical protein AAF597_00105 [Bacteroidota bacterium]